MLIQWIVNAIFIHFGLGFQCDIPQHFVSFLLSLFLCIGVTTAVVPETTNFHRSFRCLEKYMKVVRSIVRRSEKETKRDSFSPFPLGDGNIRNFFLEFWFWICLELPAEPVHLF